MYFIDGEKLRYPMGNRALKSPPEQLILNDAHLVQTLSVGRFPIIL